MSDIGTFFTSSEFWSFLKDLAWPAIIAAGVAYIIANRSVYINSVTVERSKWIEKLRTTISEFTGNADRVSMLGKDPEYRKSPEYATDTQVLRTLLSEMALRLNPKEPEAINILKIAKILDLAARTSHADVKDANELLISHAQWALKAEWEQVKKEASNYFMRFFSWCRKCCRQRAYAAFVKGKGSLEGLGDIYTDERREDECTPQKAL